MNCQCLQCRKERRELKSQCSFPRCYCLECQWRPHSERHCEVCGAAPQDAMDIVVEPFGGTARLTARCRDCRRASNSASWREDVA